MGKEKEQKDTTKIIEQINVKYTTPYNVFEFKRPECKLLGNQIIYDYMELIKIYCNGIFITKINYNNYLSLFDQGNIDYQKLINFLIETGHAQNITNLIKIKTCDKKNINFELKDDKTNIFKLLPRCSGNSYLSYYLDEDNKIINNFTLKKAQQSGMDIWVDYDSENLEQQVYIYR